jgi:hypothetical protein
LGEVLGDRNAFANLMIALIDKEIGGDLDMRKPSLDAKMRSGSKGRNSVSDYQSQSSGPGQICHLSCFNRLLNDIAQIHTNLD